MFAIPFSLVCVCCDFFSAYEKHTRIVKMSCLCWDDVDGVLAVCLFLFAGLLFVWVVGCVVVVCLACVGTA